MGKLGALVDSLARGVAISRRTADGVERRVIRVRDLRDGTVAPVAAMASHRFPVSLRLEGASVSEGDVLVALVGQKAKVSVVPAHAQGCLASGDVAVLRMKAGERARVVDYLASVEGQIALQAAQTGATIRHLSLAALREIDVP